MTVFEGEEREQIAEENFHLKKTEKKVKLSMHKLKYAYKLYKINIDVKKQWGVKWPKEDDIYNEKVRIMQMNSERKGLSNVDLLDEQTFIEFMHLIPSVKE